MDVEGVDCWGPLVLRWWKGNDRLNIVEPHCKSAGGRVHENEQSLTHRELRPLPSHRLLDTGVPPLWRPSLIK
jgi:hypothetical protein